MNDPKRLAWVIPAAICLVCLLLIEPLRTYPAASETAMVAAGISAAIAGMGLARARLNGFRGRYDLNALRDLHEQRELDELDPGDVSDYADEVVCVHCNRSYKSVFKACPYCRRVVGIN